MEHYQQPIVIVHTYVVTCCCIYGFRIASHFFVSTSGSHTGEAVKLQLGSACALRSDNMGWLWASDDDGKVGKTKGRSYGKGYGTYGKTIMAKRTSPATPATMTNMTQAKQANQPTKIHRRAMLQSSFAQKVQSNRSKV